MIQVAIGYLLEILIHKYRYGVGNFRRGINMTGCIIGSFRKYYNDIISAIQLFEENGHKILSPKSSRIERNEEGFVILSSDNPNYTHVDIQTMVFHRAFQSDFVYVWDPGGYVGKTTCYEIGRLIERKVPLYYMEYPIDVPIYVPKGSVLSIENFISYIKYNKKLPPYLEEDNLITRELIKNLEKNKFYY